MRRRFLALGAFAALALALALPVSAATYATVDGYAAGTPENNNPATWGDNCEDIGVSDVSTYELPDLGAGQTYDLVVVKAGSEESAPGHVNTLFDNPAEGETVFADTNGNGTSDPGGQDGDKDISHIIVCIDEA